MRFFKLLPLLLLCSGFRTEAQRTIGYDFTTRNTTPTNLNYFATAFTLNSATAYGPTWNGNLSVPTMDAVYDKIEAIVVGGGGVPTSRTLTAGAGLSGGGDLTADRTFTLDASTFVNNVIFWNGASATRTWTASLSGATDPVWTYGNNSADLTTGVLKYGGNTVATSANLLSFFAATTSAQLLGVISDETGTGAAVFGTSPTIVTPTIASFVNGTHTHQNAAGGGTLAESALALTDVTTANASTSAHGFLPKLNGNTGTFLNGNGAFTAGSADGTANWTASGTTNSTLPGMASVYGIVISNNASFGTSGTAGSLTLYDTDASNVLRINPNPTTTTDVSVIFPAAPFSGIGKWAVSSVTNFTLSQATAGTDYYAPGSTDVAIADGGTGSSTAAGAATNLGLGTGDSPQFTGVNIGAATDTTITRVGAGQIAVEGVNVVTATSTDTLQNKTISTTSAGGNNTITSRRSFKFNFARTVDGTGCSYSNTNDFTTNTFMVPRFSGTTVSNSNFAVFGIRVPKYISTATEMTASLSVKLTAADTAVHTYHLGMASVASSAAVAATASQFAILTLAADASGASGDGEAVNDVTLTGWAAAVTAGQWWYIELRRAGAADASTVASDLLELEIFFNVTQ